MQKVNIFWFRRDLRLHDNAGLYHALKGNYPVVPVFIFDTNILEKLENKKDRRVEFIWKALIGLQEELVQIDSSLEVFYGTPEQVFNKLFHEYDVQSVYTNHDLIKNLLAQKNINFKSYKDQVIFEKDEVLKDDGKPYTVFTPYSKKWKALLTDFYLTSYSVKKALKNFFKQSPRSIPLLESYADKLVKNDFTLYNAQGLAVRRPPMAQPPQLVA